jgi:hypothetical protein
MKIRTKHIFAALLMVSAVSIYAGGYSIANAQLTGCTANPSLCNYSTQTCVNDSCLDTTTAPNGGGTQGSVPNGGGTSNSVPNGGGTLPTNGSSGGTGLTNPLQAQNIQQLFDEILSFVITIGGVVIVLMLVLVGFKFVTAQGESEALSSARKSLFWTVIGALVLLGAKSIELGIAATIQSL